MRLQRAAIVIKLTLTLGAAAAIAAALLGRADAAPINFADHLECRSIKDTAPHLKYDASFGSNELGRQDGCVVHVPAKQVCWAVEKDSVSPPPFAAPPGTNLNGKYYLCYNMTCPKDESEFVLSDQLGGSRFVTLHRAKTICVPGF